MNYQKLARRKIRLKERIEFLQGLNQQTDTRIEQIENECRSRIRMERQAKEEREQELENLQFRLDDLNRKIAANAKEMAKHKVFLVDGDCGMKQIGRHNREILFPVAKCAFHQIFLDDYDICAHRCLSKQCAHIEILSQVKEQPVLES